MRDRGMPVKPLLNLLGIMKQLDWNVLILQDLVCLIPAGALDMNQKG